jgi:hypothetical protein
LSSSDSILPASHVGGLYPEEQIYLGQRGHNYNFIPTNVTRLSFAGAWRLLILGAGVDGIQWTKESFGLRGLCIRFALPRGSSLPCRHLIPSRLAVFCCCGGPGRESLVDGWAANHVTCPGAWNSPFLFLLPFLRVGKKAVEVVVWNTTYLSSISSSCRLVLRRDDSCVSCLDCDSSLVIFASANASLECVLTTCLVHEEIR